MKVIVIIGFTLISLLSFSCKLGKKDKEDSTTSTTTKLPVKEITITNESSRPPTAAITVNSISVKGDILSVQVSYSGGCKEHDFNLFFNSAYKKSLPPKAEFTIQHINNEDECREMVDTTIRFNITKAQYKGQNELIISLAGLNKEINYKY